MEETNKVYRIRTKVGTEAPNVIHVPLNQTYDMFEILSLKLNQTNMYKLYESNYGVIVGRVIANGGFGVENAKISIFIPVSDSDRLKDKLLYNFTSVNDRDNDGVRYNLLPDYVDDGCHQNVGTFPNKRLILDNDDVIEMFDKYWKYTTTTNHSGDYMLFGIPVGSQQLHCDIDLSDCGILSQRPRDMMSKGYNANMFESPNKFKKSKDINSLVQIVSQDRGVYVHPYWGDTSNGDEKFAITRCDINLEYKFETSAVFIGSVVTDKGNNAIGKNCTSTDNNGNMSDLITGNGKIEMIRKTVNNKVESFSIMGDRLIDGDGVWCYSIPMNLDYVTTDEFGNLVPTDNPERGIATRARVRFRFTLDENPNDASARKRASYLVPNNPKIDDAGFGQTFTPDYEFGTATREESFCDLLWNKVYTVKNYIPKLQKKADFFHSTASNRKHSGIKLINHHGDNNPMPYNALTIKLGFTYRLICSITKIIINLIEFINQLLSIIGGIFGLIVAIINLPIQLFNLLDVNILGTHPLRPVVSALTSVWRVGTYPIIFLLELLTPSCIGLSSEFCDDGVNPNIYYPGCGHFLFNLFNLDDYGIELTWKKTREDHEKNQLQICKNEGLTPSECEASLTNAVNSTAMLYNCIENQLAQQNETTSFNFYNDWVNGVLYLPLWYRKITPKKTFFFGLFKKSARDEWCSSERYFSDMRLLQDCALRKNASEDNISLREDNCGNDCHRSTSEVRGFNGVIVKKETMLGQNIYYYQAAEYDKRINDETTTMKGGIKLMFATDIVLLGALNECDIHGIPQFFKSLDNTTYNMPTDILFTDYDFIMTLDDEGKTIRYEDGISDVVKTSEMAGCDWGNPNEFGEYDGGLFYSIGCTSRSTHLEPKSCVNLSRICEFGVSLDETKDIMNLGEISKQLTDGDNKNITDSVLNNDTSGRYIQKLITDGIISWDELYNLDERSMFATMNSNHLKTKLNQKNGLVEYDFDYLYPENFDGLLKDYMRNKMRGYKSVVNYKDNYKLEQFSLDYYRFRMGKNPYFYDNDNTNAFPRYDNSYYFYFGLKAGKTAIEKFNTLYFADCISIEGEESNIGIIIKGNSWCCPTGGEDGYIAFDFSNISTPYNLSVIRESNDDVKTLNEVREEKIIFCKDAQSIPTELNDYTRKGSMLANDAYSGTVTDSNGNIVEFKFKVESKYLEYEANIQNFTMPNDILARDIGDFTNIAKDREELEYDNNELVLRKIGGVLTISQIRMPDEYVLDGYKIEIRSDEPLDGYDGVSLRYIHKTIQYSEGGQWKVVSGNSYESLIWSDKDNHNYAFGLPKADISYTVSIVQLCGDEDSGNIVEKSIDVTGPTPYKMLINDIDYDLIKRFDDTKKQPNVDNNYDYTGWKISGNLRSPFFTAGSFDVPTNPWFHIDNIYYNDKLIVDVISFIGVNNNTEKTFTYGSQDSGGRYKWNTNDVSVYTLDRNPSVNSKLFNSATTNNTVWGTIKETTWGRIDGVTYPSNKDVYSFIVELSNPDELKGFKIYGINNKNEKIGETTREILYHEFETIPENTNNVYYDWSGDYIISDFNDVEWDNVLTIFAYKGDKLVEYTFDTQDVSSVNSITVNAVNGNPYVLNREISHAYDKVNHIIVSVSNGDEKKYSFDKKIADDKYQWVFKETDTTVTPSTTTIITVSSTSRKPEVGDPVEHIIDENDDSKTETWYITEVVEEIMYEWDYTDTESGETKKIYTNTYSPEPNKDIAYNSLDDYSELLTITNISPCAGYYKWDGEENSVWTEKRNPQIGEYVYVESVLWKKDSYDRIIDRVTEEYDRIEGFVDAVNNVLQQRREIITSMYQTFYIMSDGESKDIIVRGRTEQLPCTQTFVYHKEKTPELGELNILDGKKAKAEDSDINNGVVTNIQLPTITYNGSPYAKMFNGQTGQEGTNEPILTDKYPYSVGIMNNIGVSMPEKYKVNSKSNIKYINHDNTNLIDLFNFPIIEKILSNDTIIWTAFVNIPEYNPNSNDAPKKIMMNGLLAGYIYNGNLVGREFPTRTLNNRNLLISDNLISDDRTYIEKRFIEQFEGDNDWENNYNYPFKNYKVDDVEFAEDAQYAYVEPSSAQFNLRDDASGYLSLSINGNTQFKLTKDSVHDCNDYSKTMIYLEVANAEYYYIYDAGANGANYPLIKAISHTVGTGEEAITTWEITDEINGEYDASNPQNMLSYQNRDLTKNVYVQWIGELDISDDYDPLVQHGYGNRGGFKFSQNRTPNPTFVVAETKGNIRTLSPIYDFTDVTARVGLRISSQEGDTHYYTYIKLLDNDNNNVYYLKNFEYKLRGTCIDSDVSPKVIFNEQKFNSLNEQIEIEINADQYNKINHILLRGQIWYNRLYESFQIVATDCTGLPHICKVEATWPTKTYTFNLNLPEGYTVDNGAYFIDNEGQHVPTITIENDGTPPKIRFVENTDLNKKYRDTWDKNLYEFNVVWKPCITWDLNLPVGEPGYNTVFMMVGDDVTFNQEYTTEPYNVGDTITQPRVFTPNYNYEIVVDNFRRWKNEYGEYVTGTFSQPDIYHVEWREKNT